MERRTSWPESVSGTANGLNVIRPCSKLSAKPHNLDINGAIRDILAGVLGEIDDLGTGIYAFRAGKQKRQYPVFASGEAERLALECH